MSNEQSTQGTEVEFTLRELINLRTWNSVRSLHIEAGPDRLLVSGVVPSYYLKQLVLEAVKEVARSVALPPVSLRVQVLARADGLVVAPKSA